MSTARSDGGFVLLDALMATALAASTGGSIILMANSMIEQQGRELDRSVALVAAQSMMRQILLLGEADTSADELYRYAIAPGAPVVGTAALRNAAVVATPLRGIQGEGVRLEFLLPTAMP